MCFVMTFLISFNIYFILIIIDHQSFFNGVFQLKFQSNIHESFFKVNVILPSFI